MYFLGASVYGGEVGSSQWLAIQVLVLVDGEGVCHSVQVGPASLEVEGEVDVLDIGREVEDIGSRNHAELEEDRRLPWVASRQGHLNRRGDSLGRRSSHDP